MRDARRLLARCADFGLVLFGLAVVVVIGTGGTQFRFGAWKLGLHELTNPLQGLFLFGTLRLLVARRGAGLESRLVRFYARQGMAPRHAAATLWSSLRAGVWLGAGFGTTIGIVDALALMLREWHPAPEPTEVTALVCLSLLAGWLVGGFAGGAAGWLLAAISRLAGVRPGRYTVGRWTVAVLLLVSPLAVRVARPAESPFLAVLLVLATLGVGAGVFLLVPAAVLRARQGSWGTAIAAGACLALTIALVAMGSFGGSGGGPAGRTLTHPNVLLISASGMRADALSLIRRGTIQTANADALAHRGVYAAEAVTPSTSTVEAAASMLTGLYPPSHGYGQSGSTWRPESLPEILAAHGYRTAAFVSWKRLDGRATGLAGMFQHYGDLTTLRNWLEQMSLTRIWEVVSREPKRETRRAGETVEEFRNWLSRSQGGPWFTWLEFADPARPRPVAAGGEAKGGSEPIPLPPSWSSPQAAEHPLDDWLRGYQDAILEVDRAVGEAWELLRARGELHRTLVVLVAEHGTCVGEGGVWFEEGPALPEGVIHVPWVVAGPGVAPGGRVDGPSSLVDLAPTLLGLIGLRSAKDCEGEDLSRHFAEGRRARRDTQSGPVFCESLPRPGSGARLHGVRFGPWKLVRYPDGSERFFLIERADLEREIFSFRGRQGRLHQEISDMLTRWLAQQTP